MTRECEYAGSHTRRRVRFLVCTCAPVGVFTPTESTDKTTTIRSSPRLPAFFLISPRAGNKIGAIENLGATQNQFDAIDLSDNEIVKLEGFPPLKRLHTLLLNNNRIARVGKNLEEQLPMLSCLILTNNRLNNLADVDPLVGFKHLRHVSLMGNPVTKKANYRLYVIFKLPQIKVLDFRKVKQAEREKAAATFGGVGGAADGVVENGGSRKRKAGTFEPGKVAAGAAANNREEDEEMEEEEAPNKSGPTPAQLQALKIAIANAATLEEVQRLETALTTGIVPSDLKL